MSKKLRIPCKPQKLSAASFSSMHEVWSHRPCCHLHRNACCIIHSAMWLYISSCWQPEQPSSKYWTHSAPYKKSISRRQYTQCTMCYHILYTRALQWSIAMSLIPVILCQTVVYLLPDNRPDLSCTLLSMLINTLRGMRSLGVLQYACVAQTFTSWLKELLKFLFWFIFWYSSHCFTCFQVFL